MTTADDESVDASRISFPAQLVVLIVTTVVSVLGAVWATQAGLRSDVRDIVTRMEAQREIDAERASTLKNTVESMQRRIELQQYEVQGLKEIVLKLQAEQGRR